MASFQKYETKDGSRWLYKYYGAINPETGKRKPSTKRGFRTKKEAQLDAAQVEKEIADGTFTVLDKFVTFKEVYNLWYATNSPGFKPPTRKSVKSKFKQQLLPHFGELKMKDITKAYCQEVINKMSKKIKTVDNMKMYANQIFEFAIEQDIIKSNPMKKSKIPKPEEEHYASDADSERNYWERHEAKKFLGITKRECEYRDYAIFHTSIYTGGRKGEVLAIGELDIDFKAKTITYDKTLYFEDGIFYTLTSKTAASRRVLRADDTTLGVLKKLLTIQKERQLARNESGPIKFLFTRNDGVTPLRLAYPNDLLDSLVKKHNLHPITVHGLRHTHASMQFEAGATIKEVQEQLGHSDIKITMNVYTHVTKAVKEVKANRFEKFMESEQPITGSNVVEFKRGE
ncbi:site-specific integrase [Paenibacillus sp. HN-1]|uniref:site-specific integrase n=1 Tax=Paenibacillus TaxID=44249 RepID=UPI001CA98687|nr:MULTISPECIES: site-specific integrase [Paenibacillus]MBY9077243.1 site-specific integrase [Paenibacillus sp. CGMCC 1.18879]MBY9083290.1 site-specific integrase [Paenibacillus sinensis]